MESSPLRKNIHRFQLIHGQSALSNQNASNQYVYSLKKIKFLGCNFSFIALPDDEITPDIFLNDVFINNLS